MDCKDLHSVAIYNQNQNLDQIINTFDAIDQNKKKRASLTLIGGFGITGMFSLLVSSTVSAPTSGPATGGGAFSAA